MDWDNLIKLAEIVIVPLIGFLWKRIEKSENDLKELKHEMHDHEVRAAEKYATIAYVQRIEVKFDELKNLILSLSVGGKE